MAYRREPREMHKAVCSDCGKEYEIPFKPDPDRPVHCKECWEREGAHVEDTDVKVSYS